MKVLGLIFAPVREGSGAVAEKKLWATFAAGLSFLQVAYLSNVAVRSGWRGKGLGRALITAGEQVDL